MPWLFMLFVAVSLVEIALFVFVGDAFGLWPTLGLVLTTAAIGAYLMSGQGTAVARRAIATVRAGQFPGVEMAHGAMILVGGALLPTPGFLTDGVGLGLMVPAVRERLRRYGMARVRRRVDIIDL